MQDLNKKAASESLVTVVLIILALASVSLAGYSILNLVRAGDIRASPNYNCLDLTTRITKPIQATRACFNTDSEIEILIRRSSENINIQSLSFVIEDETWRCSEICAENCEVLQEGTSKSYYLTPDQNPIDKTLEVYVGSCLIDEIRITSC